MTRSKLLVSVRSVTEAEAALAGGADLIDVKEPSRGPLGRADDRVIHDVVKAVRGRVPVSAALGEWVEGSALPAEQSLDYVKWGLAGTTRPDGGSSTFAIRKMSRFGPRPRPVLVAYADFERAGSPGVSEMCAAAQQLRFPAFLLDTAVKDDTTLRDWVAPAELARIRFGLADAGVPVAFAGSLNEKSIRELLPLAPDWFAVRGAACEGGRNGTVCEKRVRRLTAILSEQAAEG